MNLAYLLIPIVVGLAIGVSAFVVQKVDLTGYVVSPANSEDANLQISQENESKCPASCDDNNPCSIDWCNQTSNYECSHVPINGTSESCWGSPAACSTNTCVSGKCTNILLVNCCGNKVCESSEGCNSCATDCGECPPLVSPTPMSQSTQATEQTPYPTPSTQSTITESNASSQSTNTTNQTSNQTSAILDHMIINEFTTRGPNGSYDEFAELYNPTNNDIDITGWKLQYKSATGDTWQSKVGSGLTGIVKSKSFFLLTSKGYSLSTAPDYLHSANWGLSDTGGHLRIIDLNGSIIDKVGWGDANEPEGASTPALEEGKSLERRSLTTDTGNNANDFILVVPSPKNSTNQ